MMTSRKSAKQVIEKAKQVLGGPMKSSAKLALCDALRQFNQGNYFYAVYRANKSIQYSIGS